MCLGPVVPSVTQTVTTLNRQKSANPWKRHHRGVFATMPLYLSNFHSLLVGMNATLVRFAIIFAFGAAMVLSTLAKPIEAQQSDGYDEPSSSPATLTSTSLNSLVERIEALESQVTMRDEEFYEFKEIDIVKKPTIKIFGRVMIDYWAFPSDSPLVNWVGSEYPNDQKPIPPVIGNPNSFLGFRRLRLGAKGQASENMEYKIQMEFAQPDQITFKDAYLGWLNLPWNDKILVGNQKRPYGLAHLDSSRYMVFMERPFVVDAFNNDARRLGVEAYGYSDNERWNWRYGGFDMQNIAKVGRIYSNNFEPEVAGRIANTIWYDEMSGGRGYAHWALSGAACFPNGGRTARFKTRPEAYSQTSWYDTGQITNGDTYQLGGVEAVVNVNQLSVVGEYLSVEMQRTGASDLNFYGVISMLPTGSRTTTHRGIVSVACWVAPYLTKTFLSSALKMVAGYGAGEPGRLQAAIPVVTSVTGRARRESKVVSARVSPSPSTGGGTHMPVCSSITSMDRLAVGIPN